METIMTRISSNPLFFLNGLPCLTSAQSPHWQIYLVLKNVFGRVEEALEVAGIKYDRLDGTIKRDDRTRAMEALKHEPACEVLLVSLKAGGVGLNLTAAQRVYLMDPYWSVSTI